MKKLILVVLMAVTSSVSTNVIAKEQPNSVETISCSVFGWNCLVTTNGGRGQIIIRD